ncbi:HD-GYP domain-containing protein (c-di-GMP phosphodiesterase class II)/c-di-GMP-binding flagellar brake protein YcgR [Halomonas fontilapidosi]|uniref:HD-GYP domain-containing protein (C-di-GMP phosphodiesterase class II)/c-di-GMP-binding flagellar brake protein YcgR n=1 Tax=Halomonas fontilapidosi TaxID=616675 RepID=A0A7W5GXR2_9GAMM|nr:HD domain-containing phosphohydrolase [Halomonas fontilapidosi]MBB3182885.1 HD-GYP domain-containing protein (c-di-GMP phosphodiesterase class II)/c-di-GMP-binding flagellar brake protein YcgR [Halomonas fontilapidosi]
MSQQQDGYARVESPSEIEALLEALIEPGGASLQVNTPGSQPLPVLVMEQHPGEALELDISAIREMAGELKRGQEFRLLGQAQGKMLRTPAITMTECHEADGRLMCLCPFPHHLEVLQRRESFRARLRLGMEVGAILRGKAGESAQGDLKDLSLEGCQLELSLSAGALLADSDPPHEVEFCFPNDTRFTVHATPRHQQVDTERQVILSGFRFDTLSGERERQLWFLVREIEREAARYDKGGEGTRLPSLLFQPRTSTPPVVGRRNNQAYPTPMARRLARIAGYLDAQLLELQQGGEVDSVQLSRHADRLLLLHDEDRQGLLFATRCLQHEPRLVSHSLGVSVGLLELAGLSSLPREMCKTMVASAMVHDLGKALLPAELWQLQHPDEPQRQQMGRHVEALRDRMGRCHWLSANILESVAYNINERLDGSGYPRRLAGNDLHELARAAAVVDAVDAMRRDRPDRPAWRIDAIYRYLLSQPEQFDQRWVKRYIKRFGLYPVGSLVRFGSGQLAWIQAHDAHGSPEQVQLTHSAEPPGPALGNILRGASLQRLGSIQEELPVSA